MSDRDAENIRSVRGAHEAFNRGDFDAAMEIAHPEVEFIPPGGQSPMRGAEAFRAWMEPDAFEEQRVEPLEFRTNGNRVLIKEHIRARGATSGIGLDFDAWAVWTLNDDGLVTRVEGFLPHQESAALEAAGLSE